MLVTVYTPNIKLFDKIEASSIYLPSANGDMEILENHIPVLATLREGKVKINTKSSEKIEIPVTLGYVQYSENNVTIVVQQTSISNEEIESIQAKAQNLKDKSYKKDDITEKEFEDFEDSERRNF